MVRGEKPLEPSGSGGFSLWGPGLWPSGGSSGRTRPNPRIRLLSCSCSCLLVQDARAGDDRPTPTVLMSTTR
jgi:hypothetical protein